MVPVVFGYHPVRVRATVVTREHFQFGPFRYCEHGLCLGVGGYSCQQQRRFCHRRHRTVTVPVQFPGLWLVDVVELSDVVRTHVTVFQGERRAVDERWVSAPFGVHQESYRCARPFQRLGSYVVLRKIMKFCGYRSDSFSSSLVTGLRKVYQTPRPDFSNRALQQRSFKTKSKSVRYRRNKRKSSGRNIILPVWR